MQSKPAVIIVLFLVMAAPAAHAQDIVYLKNGSVIRGAIMEMTPDKSLKIETRDGSTFIYKMNEVEKITRDEAVSPAARAQDVVYLKNGSIIRGTILELTPGKSLQVETRDGSLFVYKMAEVEKLTREEAPAPAAPVAPVAPAHLAVENEPPRRLVTFDPLGFLQFGPMVGLEWRVSPMSYLTTHIRWAAAGLVYHAIASEGFENSVGADNLALGVGYRALLGRSSRHHWYARSFVEFGTGSTSGSDGGSGWTGRSSHISAIGNFGHRWHFDRSVMNVGIYAGAARELSDRWWYNANPGQVWEDYADVFPIAMLEVSLGWHF